MNWTKLLYVLIIVLLYIPMVFLGANVFFPQYTGVDSYYQGPDCYLKYPYPADQNVPQATREAVAANQDACQKKYQEEQRTWEQGKLAYEGKKYVFITLFNLLVLLFALFVPLLQDSVVMGLFLGSIASTFGATLRYFDSRSKIGFVILVITFFVMLYFINRKKDSFVDWKEKGK